MTTAGQIQRLVAPLLQRNPDLVMVGTAHVLLRPSHHTVRGIFIDRTSRASQFTPYWIIGPLFDNRRELPFCTGSKVWRKYPPLWNWNDGPDLAAEFCETIEADYLPRLRAIGTMADYITLGEGLPFFDTPFAWPEQRMLAHIAMGELEAARTICHDRSKFWDDFEDPALWANRERWRIIRTPLLNDDRSALIALLHEWEAQTVARLGIDHLWERTPFPLEEVASGSKGGMPSSAACPSE